MTMCRVPPNYMIEVGKNAHKYFDRDPTSIGGKRYTFKSLETYSREQGKSEQPSKRYFSSKTLSDLINSYPIMRKTQMTQKEIDKEKQNRLAFIDFLQGLLNLNPIERWSPQQAKRHPFITGEKFTHPFQPPFIPRKQHTASTNEPPPLMTNGFRNVPTQTYSDSYLSPTYSSLPNHYDTMKRSSYVPPLPSVLEPPHMYDQQQQTIQQQPPQHLHHLQQRNGMGRPRASTLGTMQVPPQIQWATVDHADGTMVTEGSLYSPYYPYGQPQYLWNTTVDLERDGDWQEETPKPQVYQHRRSNSSVRYSDIPTSNNQRSSLHRLVRGNAGPYKDLEWDGVVEQ